MFFSILSFVALVISVCVKKRNMSLIIQALSCLFESIYDFLIYAYTGAVLALLNFIRSFLFVNKNRFSERIYMLFLIVFESIVVCNCIITWNGYISIFPTIGSIIRTYCLWQSRMKLVRFSGVTTGVFYGIYYVYYHSWFMVLGDILLVVTGIYSLYKNDYKKC